MSMETTYYVLGRIIGPIHALNLKRDIIRSFSYCNIAFNAIANGLKIKYMGFIENRNFHDFLLADKLSNDQLADFRFLPGYFWMNYSGILMEGIALSMQSIFHIYRQ